MEYRIAWYDANRCSPEPFVAVLCHMSSNATLTPVHEGYLNDTGSWVVGRIIREPGEVLHWAEMPIYSDEKEN